MIAGFCILIETPINTPFPDKKGRDSVSSFKG